MYYISDDEFARALKQASATITHPVQAIPHITAVTAYLIERRFPETPLLGASSDEDMLETNEEVGKAIIEVAAQHAVAIESGQISVAAAGTGSPITNISMMLLKKVLERFVAKIQDPKIRDMIMILLTLL